MPVALRDLRHATRGRDWFAGARALWLEELGASPAAIAASTAESTSLLGRSHCEVLLIERDGEPVGFAVVQRVATAHRLSEFFVVRSSRSLGVGAAAARLIFDRFEGAWEISTLASDVRAIGFWRRVIARYARAGVEERRERGEVVQHFLSNGAR